MPRGGGLKGELFCLSLGCRGCRYFGSLNSSDLGGSRPWQALNSYCPLSSLAEWEASRPPGRGGHATFPQRQSCQMPHAVAAALLASRRIRINHCVQRGPAPLWPRRCFVPAAFPPPGAPVRDGAVTHFSALQPAQGEPVLAWELMVVVGVRIKGD